MRLWILALWLVATIAGAEEDSQPFDIGELPRGAVITLPHEMQTQAALDLHLQVQASDKRQLVKISTHSRGGVVRPLRVAVYDRWAKKVQYLRLKEGVSAIYQFKGISMIRLVPEFDRKAGDWNQQRLILESNRPLGVSHENGQSKDQGLSEL